MNMVGFKKFINARPATDSIISHCISQNIQKHPLTLFFSFIDKKVVNSLFSNSNIIIKIHSKNTDELLDECGRVYTNVDK